MQTTLFDTAAPAPPKWSGTAKICGRYVKWRNPAMPGISIRHTGDGRCLYGYWLEQDGESLLSELGTFGRIAHAQAVAAVLSEKGLEAAARYTAASGYMDPIYQSFAARQCGHRQPTPNPA